jgi:transcriptional regulator with PAS, ATPase and Fis domain
VLRGTGGDKKAAARLLEISVPSLYRKLDELQLKDL